MLLFVGLTHPIESDLEEKVEESIQEWFQEQRGRWEMIGVFPYDPVLREIAIDIGNCGPNPVAESLRAHFAVKMEFDDSDFVISDHTTLEDLSSAERIEHLRHKLLYLMGSIRRLNHTLGSGRMRQIEYLLGGVATEAADLLPNAQSALTTQPPLEEGWSRQLDDFWNTL
jgi:hypothetical protein